MKYILASMSPRRKEILSDMGLRFTIAPADIDENIGISDPETLVKELALLKAVHVAKKHVGEDAIIIGADTVVSYDGKILGKPKDEEEAFGMLRMLSGNTHKVYTGYSCVYAKDGKAVSKSAVALVTFRELKDSDIKAYIESGEPMDKAGAYGIQGGAASFLENLEGDIFCVIGLPANDLKKLLEEEFIFEGR